MCNCQETGYSLIPELEVPSMWDREIPQQAGYGLHNRPALPSGTPGAIASSAGCVTSYVNLIPKYLQPSLLGCMKMTIPYRLTAALYKKSIEANPGPMWVKRITGDLSGIFPTVNLTIELWHFIPVNAGQWSVLLKPLHEYLDKKEGAYTASVLGSLNAKKTFESYFGINLDSLLSSAGLSIQKVSADDYYSHYFHIYATFPAGIEKYLRKIGKAVLDKFGFDKYNLQSFHAPVIEMIARDIIESWKTSNRVTRVTATGHTDDRGTESYNLELGRKRAGSVITALREAVNRMAPGPYYSLDPAKMKIDYVVQSKGKSSPVARDASLNRRVEVFLSATPGPSRNKHLGFEFVLDHSARLLTGNKALPADKVKRILCILNKLKNNATDDRFVPGTFVQYLMNAQFPGPADWPRLRFYLANENFFGSDVTPADWLKHLEKIDDDIMDGLAQLTKIKNYDSGIPFVGNIATQHTILQTFTWIGDRARDRNSIYSCGY